LNVLILLHIDVCVYISYWEEETRSARAECEDGAIYIYHIRRKGPVLHGRSAKTVLYIYHIGRKGPVLHGWSAKTVL